MLWKNLTVILFLVFSYVPVTAQGIAIPRPVNYVSDYADILSSSMEAELNAILAELERIDSTQAAVLTVDSLQGLTIEEFAIKTVDAWKLGTAENDNGVLLLIEPNERLIRIEVGYGLEGTLTDVRAGRIINSIIIPEFRFGNYDAGVRKGIEAITASIRGEYTGDERTGGEMNGEEGEFTIIPFIVLFFIVSLLGSRRKILGGIGGAVLLPIFAFFMFPLSLPLIFLLIPGGFFLGIIFSLFRMMPWSGGIYHRGGRFTGGRGGFTTFGGGRSGGFRGSGGFGGFSGRGGGFGGGGASGRW